MPKVVITGLGFITSIGNNHASVLNSLQSLQHGIELYSKFDAPQYPVKVAATIKGFDTDSTDPEDWTYPGDYKIKRDVIRGMSPHVLYAHCALLQAIEDAKLSEADVSNEDTGLFTASAGSVMMLHHQVARMKQLGVNRCPPTGIVSSVTGTLSFNLVAAHKIKGASSGFASACASSGHALGFAFDEIALGRQKRMFVIGAEDGNEESILPFAGMRALSPTADPNTASRPFDKNRNGFVGTGGATVVVLEEEATARARSAKIYGNMLGWGHAADGYNVAISHPEGDGLSRAMDLALKYSGISPEQVDYINAHATSTPIGDLSEMRAIKRSFPHNKPALSSTKALTGHGLSLASAMEAGLTLLAMHNDFTPGSAHIEELDPEAEGLNIIQENRPSAPNIALSNSSGFGGANVSLLFQKNED